MIPDLATTKTNLFNAILKEARYKAIKTSRIYLQDGEPRTETITAIGKKIVVTFRDGKSGIIFREPLDPALSFCELAALADEMIRQNRA